MLLARRTALTASRAGRRTLSTAQQTTTERYPVLWQAAALYCGGGLAVSAYQLLNADCRDAIEKAHTDAWGARRRLEGFDEVLEWLEWSEAGVGCDVAPKLVRQGALTAAVDGLSLSLNLWFDFEPRLHDPPLPLKPGLLLELARADLLLLELLEHAVEKSLHLSERYFVGRADAVLAEDGGHRLCAR